MYRNTESLCHVTGTNSVVGQLYVKNKQTNKLIEEEIRFVVARGGGWVEVELDKGSQKVQTSSYINKY